MADRARAADHELLARAQRGDRDALGVLLAQLQPELEVYVRLNGAGRFRSRESVDDVTQSVFAECIAELGRFEDRGPGSLRAWLRRIALCKLTDKLRYHSAAARDLARERPLPDRATELPPLVDTLHQLPSPSQAAIRREEAELLERAMAQLSDEHRQVVTMARILGMSHAEIGEVLQKSEPACRVTLRRAMVRLSALMEELDQG